MEQIVIEEQAGVAEEEQNEEHGMNDESEEGQHAGIRNRNRNTTSGRQYIAPPELKLTDMEKDWAWDLIERVEAPAARSNRRSNDNDNDNDDATTTTTTRLRRLTDFEYASYVLVTGGNLDEAMKRMEGMQQFRDYYDVQDTVEEGIAILQEFIQLQPGSFLNVDVLGPNCMASVFAWDYSAFVPARAFASTRAWRVHALFWYYQSRMHQATLQAVREGVIFLGQSDMRWENVDTNFTNQMDAELFKHDPVKFKGIMIYNTNSIASTAFSLFKPIMPSPIRDVLQLGCQIEYSLNPSNPKLKLKDIYFQPTYDVAMEHLVQQARSLLEM